MLIGFYLSIRIWFRVKGARRKVIKSGGEIVIALKLNHDIGRIIKTQFKDIEIEIIDANILLGKATIDTDHEYTLLAKKVREIMALNQQKHIHLCLSGPLGLSFLIGQLAALHLFSVEVYQYRNNFLDYQRLPMVTRDWLLL